jgi:hypothetical protein
MVEIINMESQLNCIFPGSLPIILQTYSKGTPFDKEVKEKYGFPETKETKDDEGDLKELGLFFGRKMVGDKVIAIPRLKIRSDHLEVAVVGDHETCDAVVREITSLMDRYSTVQLPWPSCIRLPRCDVKAKLQFDTNKFFSPRFLEIARHMGNTIYSDDRLSTEIHPSTLLFAYVSSMTIPESDLIGPERAKMELLTSSPRYWLIRADSPAEFQSKIFSMSGPLRSEAFLPFIENLEKELARL